MTSWEDPHLPRTAASLPVRWSDAKHRAVVRLLEWGFEREVIARLLGCSVEWIQLVDEEHEQALELEEDFTRGNPRYAAAGDDSDLPRSA